MSNPWEQMLLVGAKKQMSDQILDPKKTVEPFSNGSLKESLLNTSFNNGSMHRTVVKGSV
jgi:hypothetical protein